MAATPENAEAQMRTAQLLREAEEALAEERLRTFWTTHGKTILGMAVMLVLGTAAGTGWRTWRAHVNAASTDILLQATVPTQTGEPNVQLLQGKTASLTGAQKTIGDLVLASQNGDDAALRAQLKTLFGTDTAPDKNTWKWLKAWGAARLQMDDEKIAASDLESKFTALAKAQNGNGLGALAYIDAALVAAERGKDPARAVTYLDLAQQQTDTKNGAVYGLVEELQHLYTTMQETAATKKDGK